EVEAEPLRRAEGVTSARAAASAGEDYELCFCISSDLRERAQDAVSELGAPGIITWIGSVEPLAAPSPTGANKATNTPPDAPGVRLLDEHGHSVQLQGYEHSW